jgi:hypothetical protein
VKSVNDRLDQIPNGGRDGISYDQGHGTKLLPKWRGSEIFSLPETLSKLPPKIPGPNDKPQEILNIIDPLLKDPAKTAKQETAAPTQASEAKPPAKEPATTLPKRPPKVLLTGVSVKKDSKASGVTFREIFN